jgi:hypothetical protein
LQFVTGSIDPFDIAVQTNFELCSRLEAVGVESETPKKKKKKVIQCLSLAKRDRLVDLYNAWINIDQTKHKPYKYPSRTENMPVQTAIAILNHVLWVMYDASYSRCKEGRKRDAKGMSHNYVQNMSFRFRRVVEADSTKAGELLQPAEEPQPAEDEPQPAEDELQPDEDELQQAGEELQQAEEEMPQAGEEMPQAGEELPQADDEAADDEQQEGKKPFIDAWQKEPLKDLDHGDLVEWDPVQKLPQPAAKYYERQGLTYAFTRMRPIKMEDLATAAKVQSNMQWETTRECARNEEEAWKRKRKHSEILRQQKQEQNIKKAAVASTSRPKSDK